MSILTRPPLSSFSLYDTSLAYDKEYILFCNLKENYIFKILNRPIKQAQITAKTFLILSKSLNPIFLFPDKNSAH